MRTILLLIPVLSSLLCAFQLLRYGPKIEASEGYWAAVIVPWSISLIIIGLSKD